LYLAALVVLRLTGVINENWVPIALGASFLYDLSFVPQGWYVSHMWSLAVEEQFYLLCPLLLLLCRPRRRGRVFGCLFALCIAWNLVLPLLGEPNPVIDSRTRAGFACICFGVLTAIYEQRARSIAVRTSGWMVAALAFILLLHPVPQGRVNEALFSAIFTPFAIALILTYSLEHNGWLKVLLCAKPIQSVGITSYGVYLWQQIFTGPLVIYSGAGAIIPYLLPALIAIVPISYFVVEKPAMRLGKSLSAAVQSKRRLPEQRAEAVASIPHDLILPAKRTP